MVVTTALFVELGTSMIRIPAVEGTTHIQFTEQSCVVEVKKNKKRSNFFEKVSELPTN